MKKYSPIFSSFHTIYRLTTTLTDIKSFSIGVCKLYKNIFKVNKVVMIIHNSGPKPQTFTKIRVEGKDQNIKKGNMSMLTHMEKQILKHDEEMTSPNRLSCSLIFIHTLGAIYIQSDKKMSSFSRLDKEWFLSLCEKVSTSLKILNLYQEQERLMLNYIRHLSEFLNRHVPTSHLHKKTILKLISAIAKKMKLSEIESRSLEHAALLHDAGKIKVPSRLLRKQKPLTPNEFKLISLHPRKGVELIKNMQILKPAIPIILHHHERYDGNGYPSRLKKDKIPIGSRILAVLDAFDAMYFGRPYKKEQNLDEIEREFKHQRGKQFDPKIVDMFLKIIRRKGMKKYLTALPKDKKTAKI